MKEQIEKLKQEMSELITQLLKIKTTSLVFVGITGWFICPLLSIAGLFAKLYFRLKKK